MNVLDELLADRARAAMARFFLRSGRAKGLQCGDGVSLPLFPLTLIIEAEGLLARETQFERCRALIKSISLDVAA